MREFFQYVKEFGNQTYEYYEAASGYGTLCDFFKTYVLNESSIQEPSEENYHELLDGLMDCIEDMQNYKAADGAYTRLTIYEAVLNLLNVNLKGFAVNNVEEKQVREVLLCLRESMKKESITQERTIEKQKELLSVVENVLDNLQREYKNMERGV